MIKDNYNGYEITLITNGKGNHESWYTIKQNGITLIHWFIRGRLSSCESIHHIVDNMRGSYPKMLMQP